MLRIVEAKTFKDKLIGFMGKEHIEYGLFFWNVRSIHTFFMKVPIDIVGLDDNMVVREIFFNVSPNKIIFLRKSRHTLELPKFGAKKYKIGDVLKI